MDTKKTTNRTVDKNIEELSKYPVDITNTFYANAVRTFNNQYEFALDFIQQPVRDDGAFEGLRIYLNPQSFKIFTQLFIEQLKKYEKQFGEIKL